MALFSIERQEYDRKIAKLQSDLDTRVSVLRAENAQLRKQLDAAEHWIKMNPTPIRGYYGKSHAEFRKRRSKYQDAMLRRSRLAQIAAAAIRVYLWYFVEGIDPTKHPYALSKLFAIVEKELGKEFKQSRAEKAERILVLKRMHNPDS